MLREQHQDFFDSLIHGVGGCRWQLFSEISAGCFNDPLGHVLRVKFVWARIHLTQERENLRRVFSVCQWQPVNGSVKPHYLVHQVRWLEHLTMDVQC